MITVNQLAKLVDGLVEGDGDAVITGMAPLSLAQKGDLTFALSEKDFLAAQTTTASCILTVMQAPPIPKTLLRIKDPKIAITILYDTMTSMLPPAKGGIHPSAIISDNAVLGKNVYVGENVVIGDGSEIGDDSYLGANTVIGKAVKIGSRTKLYPNVTIYDGIKIGNKVRIHASTVIGADGFGYIPKDGKIYKVPQMGIVVIEDNVEIGANTCIDRATFGETVISEGSKIDNLVQVAHNVKMGKNVIMAAQSGIAGSAVIGENTMMGGQVGIADHAKVGKNVIFAAKSGVSGRTDDNVILYGYPAREGREFKRINAMLSLFAKHADKLKKLLRDTPHDEEVKGE